MLSTISIVKFENVFLSVYTHCVYTLHTILFQNPLYTHLCVYTHGLYTHFVPILVLINYYYILFILYIIIIITIIKSKMKTTFKVSKSGNYEP